MEEERRVCAQCGAVFLAYRTECPMCHHSAEDAKPYVAEHHPDIKQPTEPPKSETLQAEATEAKALQAEATEAKTLQAEDAPTATETAAAQTAPVSAVPQKHKKIGVIIAVACVVVLLAVAVVFVIPEIRVRNVETLIGDIGEVSINSKDAIDEAREQFNALPKELQRKVDNKGVLSAAEEEYEQVKFYEDNRIKNYAYLDTPITNKMAKALDRTTADAWLESEVYGGALYLMLLVDADVDGGDMDFKNQYICAGKGEERVDLYATYKSDMIIGFQYWPQTKTAQWGTVKTDLSPIEYVLMLQDQGIIDDYDSIANSTLYDVMEALSDALK